VKTNVAIVWGAWGPYHHARFKNLSTKYKNGDVYGIAISEYSSTYKWSESDINNVDEKFITLFKNCSEETVSLIKLFFNITNIIKNNKIDVVFIPSYWPARNLTILLASKMCGCSCIMMNDSHALTEKATGWKRIFKGYIIRQFDSALVAGTPHVRFFNSYGIKKELIYQVYDAIDNEYFFRNSNLCKQNRFAYRFKLGLPKKYLLSLGRLIPSKNIETLIKAYAIWCESIVEGDNEIALVIAGDGVCKRSLIEIAKKLKLNVSLSGTAINTRSQYKMVYFLNASSYVDNPAIYSLAELFVLPTLSETWGLVVNEAMASGCPVLVSKFAGCAEDLVLNGVNGFQFDPNNAEELASILTKCFSDEVNLKKMGNESQRIISHWGLDKFSENAISAIKSAEKN
jgi:glycosyltransferase involved in cell wall biosynthesis